MNKDISVCMIAKNCGDIVKTSLRWAVANFEEINIVVDTENDDNTGTALLDFAVYEAQPKHKHYGIYIQEHSFDNFSAQKQRALDMATKPWVLLMDSDEIFENDVPWGSVIRSLDRNNLHGATFNRLNLQGDVDHFKIPTECIYRLVRKDLAKMDGKPVDEMLMVNDPSKIINLMWSIIHFGHIRPESALLLKGKDRIKFINSDPCDGPGLREHGDEWFIKRNDLWNQNVAGVPVNVKNTIRRYYNG